MLEGEHLVCFAPEPWQSMWRSRQQIMARIARTNNVLFVEPRPYLRTLVKSLLKGHLAIGALRPEGPKRLMENLYIYRPPAFAPVSGKQSIERLTGLLRAAGLRQAMRSLGMSKPILWLERPDMGNEAGHYDEKLLIYRVVDEYSAYNDVDGGARLRIRQREADLLRKADLVLVASESLRRAKSPFNSQTYLLPHGVDYDGFATACASDWLPDEIKELPRPVIGYSGLIAARLDFELLTKVALSCRNSSLVLLGEVNNAGCEREIQRLRELANVHFLGPVEVWLVPHYLKAFDVGLIPYRLDDQALNINPLKLLEYLACGSAVVSVDIPSVRPFAGVAKVAVRQEDFVALVEEALAGTSPETAARRRAAAAENTWESRVALFSELVEAALRRKGQVGKTTGAGRPADSEVRA